MFIWFGCYFQNRKMTSKHTDVILKCNNGVTNKTIRDAYGRVEPKRLAVLSTRCFRAKGADNNFNTGKHRWSVGFCTGVTVGKERGFVNTFEVKLDYFPGNTINRWCGRTAENIIPYTCNITGHDELICNSRLRYTHAENELNRRAHSFRPTTDDVSFSPLLYNNILHFFFLLPWNLTYFMY